MLETMRARRPSPVARAWPVAAGVALFALLAPTRARAGLGVTGKEGIEIEGPRDRRGFYIGPDVAFAATFFGSDLMPSMKIGLSLGGGVTKRITLGANVHVSPYLRSGGYVGFGGDIELTGFVVQGFYLRLGVGGMAMPKGPDDNGLTGGVGGRPGLGYEFFLNQSAALGVGLDYDIRIVPENAQGELEARHGILAGLRFTWY